MGKGGGGRSEEGEPKTERKGEGKEEEEEDEIQREEKHVDVKKAKVLSSHTGLQRHSRLATAERERETDHNCSRHGYGSFLQYQVHAPEETDRQGSGMLIGYL